MNSFVALLRARPPSHHDRREGCVSTPAPALIRCRPVPIMSKLVFQLSKRLTAPGALYERERSDGERADAVEEVPPRHLRLGGLAGADCVPDRDGLRRHALQRRRRLRRARDASGDDSGDSYRAPGRVPRGDRVGRCSATPACREGIKYLGTSGVASRTSGRSPGGRHRASPIHRRA